MTSPQHDPRFKLLSAVHVFLHNGKHILLLRRFNTGYEDGNYSVIAGHLDGDETVIDAACRETLEEVGIALEPANTRVVGVMHRKSSDERIDWFVTANQWQGELVNNEPDKCDQIGWYELDKLPENIIPYIRQAISNYHSGRWFDSFGWS